MLRVRTALTGWDGGPGLMTTYFTTPLQNAESATRVVAYVQAWLGNVVRAYMPDSIAIQVSGDVDVLDSVTGAITDTLSVTPPDALAGTGGSSKAPPSVAALIQLSTANFVAGRRVRGRIFVSPLAAAVVTADGVLSGAAQAALGGYYTYMDATEDAGDLVVVWHRPKGGAGGLACAVTATSAPFKLATLVSRRD